MAERDGAAVEIDLVRVEAELAQDGQRLGREGLVELDQVDVVEGEAGALRAPCGWPGPGRCP